MRQTKTQPHILFFFRGWGGATSTMKCFFPLIYKRIYLAIWTLLCLSAELVAAPSISRRATFVFVRDICKVDPARVQEMKANLTRTFNCEFHFCFLIHTFLTVSTCSVSWFTHSFVWIPALFLDSHISYCEYLLSFLIHTFLCVSTCSVSWFTHFLLWVPALFLDSHISLWEYLLCSLIHTFLTVSTCSISSPTLLTMSRPNISLLH